MKKIAVVIVAALMCTGAPARADEKADLLAACGALGLGEKACLCIADDTMTRFANDPAMREVILVSFGDGNLMSEKRDDGTVTDEEYTALQAYQAEMEPICVKDE